jgi:N-acetylglutamate synthase-like GNAT family acetyltransferase
MIRSAQEQDAEALVQLINQAFLVERFFLDSDRIDLEQVRKFLKLGFFLIAEENDQPVACIYIEVRESRGYFGLLSVEPSRQRSGLGKRLIATAEEYCREAGCAFMDLQIVDLRTELPPFYQKLGYIEEGTAPFPADVATKLPCHFIKMSKGLSC